MSWEGHFRTQSAAFTGIQKSDRKVTGLQVAAKIHACFCAYLFESQRVAHLWLQPPSSWWSSRFESGSGHFFFSFACAHVIGPLGSRNAPSRAQKGGGSSLVWWPCTNLLYSTRCLLLMGEGPSLKVPWIVKPIYENFTRACIGTCHSQPWSCIPTLQLYMAMATFWHLSIISQVSGIQMQAHCLQNTLYYYC